ncbi:hypothetical protein [Agrobacterium tumefaciens]|uniref:hypothetical protein n=1 Tax=Agrobacterium tumefaciens TaxID=358 RepID=UPI001574C377|nr:hypothetical protein [Agrobacterium tumefaciens]NTD85510.1 hypothetical protein [Agrobacterium tumefaciens]NTD90859.1 hypothetical protein [Agrobacterium tumefaciens]NTE03681.1 hypothetical protein [Agrobacterium tumefaciens]NTE15933.1 hypothetical protein [Agrobacterium tumefaciens]NTE26507.1 hypothetical protein [Agrobacterium tumefaciens]
MELSSEISKWFLEHGPFGGFALIMVVFYVYERIGRGKDREAHDARIRELQDEHIETLKTLAPLVQKFTDTMDTVLPMVVTHGNRRGE